MIVKVKSLFFVLLGPVALGLTFAGMENFPGSTLVYFLFSLSFWLMLITAFNRRSPFGYVFLAVMLWLGVWVKLTAHLILGYPYAEPVGSFDGSSSAWDDVLWVGIVASLCVMFGRLIGIVFSETYSIAIRCEQFMAPEWYPALRSRICLFMSYIQIRLIKSSKCFTELALVGVNFGK